MKKTTLIALAGMAALSLAGCKKTEEAPAVVASEPAATEPAMASEPAMATEPADAASAAASTSASEAAPAAEVDPNGNPIGPGKG